MFQQITILGPGLLGASIAMTVKARGLSARIHTWSRRETTREKCGEQSWCDAVFDSAEAAVEGSDLVIVCTPVETIVPLMASCMTALKSDAIVTDVGSTKLQICEGMAALFDGTGPVFVGSHPMAGSERAGLEHAKVDLLDGAACIVVDRDVDHEAAERVIDFWTALGMRLCTTSASEHDAIVAHVSHLPHVLASALCVYLSEKPMNWGQLSGGGLRDTTRVAAGDAELWRQILESNQTEVVKALDGFIEELTAFKSALQAGESDALTQLLTRGRDYRNQL